jgi:hypothetical protein
MGLKFFAFTPDVQREQMTLRFECYRCLVAGLFSFPSIEDVVLSCPGVDCLLWLILENGTPCGWFGVRHPGYTWMAADTVKFFCPIDMFLSTSQREIPSKCSFIEIQRIGWLPAP